MPLLIKGDHDYVDEIESEKNAQRSSLRGLRNSVKNIWSNVNGTERFTKGVVGGYSTKKFYHKYNAVL